jgi:hypothetical protein
MRIAGLAAAEAAGLLGHEPQVLLVPDHSTYKYG